MKIKERIISRVNDIDDQRLLEEIMRVLDLETKDQVYELSEKEEQALAEGLKDADEGKLHTQSEAREWVRQWQKK